MLACACFAGSVTVASVRADDGAEPVHLCVFPEPPEHQVRRPLREEQVRGRSMT
jgi:hypothetical protein